MFNGRAGRRTAEERTLHLPFLTNSAQDLDVTTANMMSNEAVLLAVIVILGNKISDCFLVPCDECMVCLDIHCIPIYFKMGGAKRKPERLMMSSRFRSFVFFERNGFVDL
jgi:hypothetical protein